MTSTTYSRETRDVTLPLRTTYPIRTFGAETVTVDFASLPVAVLVEILEQGAARVLNDGCGAKDTTDAEKVAKMRKRIDAWQAGNFRIVERGDASVTLMRLGLRAKVNAAIGGLIDDAGFDKFQRDSLAAAKIPAPEKGKAIPIESIAAARAKLDNPKATDAELAKAADALMAEWEAAGVAERAKAAQASAAIDVSAIKL